MLSLAVVALVAASALAQPDGPAPKLNPNPTDTNNPRLVGKACVEAARSTLEYLQYSRFPFNQLVRVRSREGLVNADARVA